MIDPNQDFESYFNSLPTVDAQLPAGDYRSTMQSMAAPVVSDTGAPLGGNTGINGTPTGTVQPAPSSGTSSGPISWQTISQAWIDSPYPGTVDGWKQFFAAHPEYAAAGYSLGGSKGDKLYGPGGAYYGDFVRAAGEGGTGKLGGGPDVAGGAGSGSTLGSLGYAFGSSMAPFTDKFSAPNPAQIASDPYYQFQMKEGLKGIEGSAAAHGTLLSGGTLKALDQYGQGVASSFGDKLYDRSMGEYLLNRDNFFQNQDRPFSKNLSLAQLGAPR